MTLRDDKIVAAMSGGVDSSVAAALLQRAGWEVIGAHFHMRGRGSSLQADARRIAGTLGIEFFEEDLSRDFEPIVEGFLAEYARGRTPNPCVHCNARVKFAALLRLADAQGAGWVATGHHARVVRRDGTARVARAVGSKDQSYALMELSTDVLERVRLPIGEIEDKRRVRRLAREIGLDVHDKPDSQEICFLAGEDYTELLRRRRPEALRAGEIVDSAGDVLGRHEGCGRYTIGQRRGLGVAAGVPMYVTAIDPAAARVTIGPEEEVLSRRLSASGAVWHEDVPQRFAATVQIRYNHAGAPGRVERTGDEAFRVEFDGPVKAVTPGQAAVVYDGDLLLGGGWIDG